MVLNSELETGGQTYQLSESPEFVTDKIMAAASQASAVAAILRSDDAMADLSGRLRHVILASAINNFADSQGLSREASLWLVFAACPFLLIRMIDDAHGATNRFVDSRNNSVVESICPPTDLIILAYEIQASESDAVAMTRSEFRRFALLEHLCPSESANSLSGRSDNSTEMHRLDIISPQSDRPPHVVRLTANGRALRELKNLCSGRSSLVWMVCALGIGVFIVVHSEFSGRDLKEGMKWLFDNV